MTEGDLSIFLVHTWTRHGKLGGVRLLRFFDTSLCFREIAAKSLPQIGSDPPYLSTVQLGRLTLNLKLPGPPAIWVD